MNQRVKNLLLAGGSVAVVGFVATNTLMAPAAPPASPTHGAAPDAAPGPGVAPPVDDPTPIAQAGATPAASGSGTVDQGGPGPSAPVADASRRSYALGLHDLDGFPPDAAPGARLELWVTWGPPVTEEPRLQKLIGDVVLERTIPGAIPEAPVTVLLSVPADRIGDLIYADGYGKLSVALPE